MVTQFAYRDAAGVVHEVVVRNTPTGDWEVLDTGDGEERLIESLDGRLDGEAQADAVATDYVTASRFMPVAGRNRGEPIPEQGGADVPSDHRPLSAARK
jgi:hypothetical protein